MPFRIGYWAFKRSFGLIMRVQATAESSPVAMHLTHDGGRIRSAGFGGGWFCRCISPSLLQSPGERGIHLLVGGSSGGMCF